MQQMNLQLYNFMDLRFIRKVQLEALRWWSWAQ